jgi:hypothetical protein
MFIFWWVGAKFVPGGSALTGAMVNCFVHIVMYSYYGLAAFGPKISEYLWWKKYLTILQLVSYYISYLILNPNFNLFIFKAMSVEKYSLNSLKLISDTVHYWRSLRNECNNY